MNALEKAVSRPISFGRHVTALLGANFVIATAFACSLAIFVAVRTGSASMIVSMAFVTWIGVFVISVPASAWPFLRKAQSFGLVISALIGGEGGAAVFWANYAGVGKRAETTELLVAGLAGAFLGIVYWLLARPSPSRRDGAPAGMVSVASEEESPQFELRLSSEG
jgi:hypothetical protein